MFVGFGVGVFVGFGVGVFVGFGVGVFVGFGVGVFVGFGVGVFVGIGDGVGVALTCLGFSRRFSGRINPVCVIPLAVNEIRYQPFSMQTPVT